jgi:hypothetical protein
MEILMTEIAKKSARNSADTPESEQVDEQLPLAFF